MPKNITVYWFPLRKKKCGLLFSPWNKILNSALQAYYHISNADLIYHCLQVKQSWTLKGRKENPWARWEASGVRLLVWFWSEHTQNRNAGRRAASLSVDTFQSKHIIRIWNIIYKESYSEIDVLFHLASSCFICEKEKQKFSLSLQFEFCMK